MVPASFLKVILCQKLSSKLLTLLTPPPAAVAAKVEAAAVETVIDALYTARQKFRTIDLGSQDAALTYTVSYISCSFRIYAYSTPNNVSYADNVMVYVWSIKVI